MENNKANTESFYFGDDPQSENFTSNFSPKNRKEALSTLEKVLDAVKMAGNLTKVVISAEASGIRVIVDLGSRVLQFFITEKTDELGNNPQINVESTREDYETLFQITHRPSAEEIKKARRIKILGYATLIGTCSLIAWGIKESIDNIGFIWTGLIIITVLYIIGKAGE